MAGQLLPWMPLGVVSSPWWSRGCTALVCLGAWSVWYNLVLWRAARSSKVWGPRWLAHFLSGVLYKFGRWYLTFSHNTEDAIKAGIFHDGKQYIYVWHPHGAFTIAALYFVSHWFAQNYPCGDSFCGVAPLLLKIPGLAEFLILCNARSVESQTFNMLLREGYGVAVQPGGLREQVETDENFERLIFPTRLGFIRLALKYGVPILPIYAFGENQLYRTSSWIKRLNGWFFKNLGTGNLVVLGQGSLPNSPIVPNPLLLPVFRRGLHIRWGEPVDVGPADPNPSDERIRETFAKYTAELRKIFDKHKEACLPPKVAARGLEIVWDGEKKEANDVKIKGMSKKVD